MGPGVPEHEGDSVRYTEGGDRREVVFTRTDPPEDVVIGWDAVTKAGSIQAPNYNGGKQACWGSAPSLRNVACGV